MIKQLHIEKFNKIMRELNFKRINKLDGYHYFFGYYDLQPYSFDGKKHLAHRVSFAKSIPQAEDVAELGFIDIESGEFHKVAETTAWNFQQGALLQWYDENHIIYNYCDKNGFCSMITSLDGLTSKRICRPLANISLKKQLGLSINFGRIYDFRPGYGYAGLRDVYVEQIAPENDGVYLVDLVNNTSKMIISLAKIKKQFVKAPYDNAKLVINHITFNPSGNRFLMLIRTFSPDPNGDWTTMLVTSDLDGNMIQLTDFVVNSHYYWENDNQFIIYSRINEGYGIYRVTDITGKIEKIQNKNLFDRDIHCITHPSGKYFIGDTYQDSEGKRSIHYYNIEKDEFDILLKTPSGRAPADARCDLHARFNREGNRISFDNFSEEFRDICQTNEFNNL